MFWSIYSRKCKISIIDALFFPKVFLSTSLVSYISYCICNMGNGKFSSTKIEDGLCLYICNLSLVHYVYCTFWTIVYRKRVLYLVNWKVKVNYLFNTTFDMMQTIHKHNNKSKATHDFLHWKVTFLNLIYYAQKYHFVRKKLSLNLKKGVLNLHTSHKLYIMFQMTPM